MFSTHQITKDSKILEQLAFKTRPRIEEHMLIVLDKIVHAEQLS